MSEKFYLFVLVVIISLFIIYFAIEISLRFVIVAIIYPVIALIPVIAYIPVYSRLGVSFKDRFCFLLFAIWLSAVLWFIAEAIWCWYYNLLLNVEVPYPSEADIFYIAGCIPSIIGLFVYIRAILREIHPRLSLREKIIGYSSSIILTLVIGTLLFYPLLSAYEEILEEEGLLVIGLDITYILLDIILIIIAITGLILIRGKIGKIILLILVSSILVVIYDLVFAILDMFGLYYDGHPIEILDLISYLIDTMAFYETYKMLKS